MEQSSGRAPLEHWAQQVIHAQIERAGDSLTEYREKPSAKRLHTARKHLERLRTALDDLSPLAGVSPEFRERVEALHRRAGKLRDIDVLLHCLRDYAGNALDQERKQLDAVRDAFRARRKKARRKLAGTIATTVPELRR